MAMNISFDTANYTNQVKSGRGTTLSGYDKLKFGNSDSNNSSEEKQIESTANGLGKVAFLTAVQKIITKLSSMCYYAITNTEEFTSKENIDKVVQSMKTDNKLPTEVHFLDKTNVEELKGRFPKLAKNLDVVAKGENAFFYGNGNITVAPKSKPSLILHELGHAINNHKKGIMYYLQKSRIVGMYITPILGAINSVISLFGHNQDEKENFIERHAGKIGFLAYLPTIIEEAAASIRGIKAAEKTLGKSAKLSSLKWSYLFAWSTYLLGGIATGIASRLTFSKDKS